MRRILHFVILVSVILWPGGVGIGNQLKIQKDEGANPWTHLNVNNHTKNFHFVIVADRTGGHRPGVFADAIQKINLLQPEFVVCIGDLIEGGTQDIAQLDREWKEMDDILARLEMPFFYVVGNHDIGNSVMLKTWKERLGRSYYHFLYHDVLFLCLNTEGDNNRHEATTLSSEQLEYFHQVLKKHPNVRWTLAFMHKPLWEMKPAVWAKFETLLGDRNFTAFAGHKHQYAFKEKSGRKYIRLATTGGLSEVKGAAVTRNDAIRLGKFDHIMWVTMREEGPRIANLTLDGIWGENVTPFLIASTAEFLKKQLDQGRVVQCAAIPVTQDTFRRGKADVLYTNFAALPLKVTLQIQDHPQVKVTLPAREIQVLPFSTKTISLPVKSLSPVPLEELTPLHLTSNLRYSIPLQKPFTCTLTHTIPFAKIKAPKRTQKAKSKY
jgi:predicted phosphodiesterase